MAVAGAGAHILVFPYPAQGHMISLLDLTHQLAVRGLTITILVTPKNLSFLDPLLSKHPSIKPLVLPFPVSPSIPAGVENLKDLPVGSFSVMMAALGELYNPMLNWFESHPSPPVAIISDMFLGWTHRLACQLSIRRFVFCPSGALAMSVIFALWRDMRQRNDPGDENELISFPEIPNSPVYPWSELSPVYRSFVAGGPRSEFLKDAFLGNIASWGIVINSFSELERVYLDYLKESLGHDRVWSVGPLLPPEIDRVSRGGSSSVLASEITSWLDKFDDQTVVYVCFGSLAVLTNKQMEELALGLEKSGVNFLWSSKIPTEGHVEGEYGMVPLGFQERVAGRGLVIKGWVPQVSILSHRAVGAFLTHCGWNSVLESIVAGVPMLAWPMGADQFVNTDLLDELKVGIRVCKGANMIPDSDELARLVAKGVNNEERGERIARAKELSKAALVSTKIGGSSYKSLDELVRHLSQDQDFLACDPKKHIIK